MKSMESIKQRKREAQERREMKRVQRFASQHRLVVTVAFMLLTGCSLLLFLALASNHSLWAVLVATFPLRWGTFTLLTAARSIGTTKILPFEPIWKGTLQIVPELAAALWLGTVGLPPWTLLVLLISVFSEDLALGCLTHVPEPGYPFGRPRFPGPTDLAALLKSETWMLLATVTSFAVAWTFHQHLH